MKRFIHVFLLMFCAMPGMALAQVATTAGNNLTAFNSNIGATNNNEWNQMMNPRAGAGVGTGAPVADFDNCNSLILRCAQPKCAGGCTTMDVARPIVAGCVNSNATCKKHGDALINSIAAQMVSNAEVKAQQAQMQAQAIAAQVQAAESNAQMQQMQAQMQQMQQQMAEQNKQQMEQMQAALEEQKAMTEAALAEAAAAREQQVAPAAPADDGNASANSGLTAAQQKAAEAGIDADILVREQISGQILTKIENAEIALKKLNAQMQDTFKYAGCDVFGNNCAGPKRVKKFKEMAQEYFRPYDEVVDNAYEGLEMALAVGVDVSDVIMMLSGACNRWGKFLCNMPQTKNKENAPYPRYDSANCRGEKSVKGALARVSAGGEKFETTLRGGFECSPGMVVPPQDDVQCTLVSFVGGEGEGDEVLREWLLEGEEGDGMTRVGCATSALDTLPMFGRRSSRRDSSSTLDLDTLERILVQDAPEVAGQNRFMRSNSETPETSRLKYCAMTPRGYETLRGVLSSKKLPKKICVPYDTLARSYETQGSLSADYNGTSGLMASGVMPGVNKYTCDTYFTSGEKGVPSACNSGWVGDKDKGSCNYNATNCVLEYDYSGDGIKALRELTLDEKRERGCQASDSGGTWNASEKKCDCPSGKTVRNNTSYQCVSAEAITDADCKKFAEEMGADDDDARVNGDGTCVAKNYQLINYGYCDVRKCTGEDVTKRKITDGAYDYNVCCWCNKGGGYAFNPDRGSCTESGGGIVNSAALDRLANSMFSENSLLFNSREPVMFGNQYTMRSMQFKANSK